MGFATGVTLTVVVRQVNDTLRGKAEPLESI